MFKKNLCLALCLLFTATAFAQNVQLHYAPRHGVDPKNFSDNLMVTTLEMFKPDKWGSTFAFVDMTYGGAKGGVSSAYWEIARDLKFWDAPVAAHIEYNGGTVEGFPGAIPNAYLVGASYSLPLGKAFMSTYVAYKYHAFQKQSNDIQWTVTWSLNLLDDKFSVVGFADLWSENKNRFKSPGEDGKKAVFLAQPQFWYNVNTNLSLGTEIEISNEFHPITYDFYCIPTLAAKWSF